jgi:hypothetical protein
VVAFSHKEVLLPCDPTHGEAMPENFT